MASRTGTTRDLITEFENSNHSKIFSVFNRNNEVPMILRYFNSVIVMEVTSFVSFPAGFTLAGMRLSAQDKKYYHIC